MAIKLYKPTTPARRGMTTADTAGLTKKKPAKSLLSRQEDWFGSQQPG